jgi:hypothetical protein
LIHAAEIRANSIFFSRRPMTFGTVDIALVKKNRAAHNVSIPTSLLRQLGRIFGQKFLGERLSPQGGVAGSKTQQPCSREKTYFPVTPSHEYSDRGFAIEADGMAGSENKNLAGKSRSLH